MTDHPSTYQGDNLDTPAIDWDDHASVHQRDDGQGIFDAMKGLHRGTFAEMVAMVANMPEDRRDQFVIQKAGDRQFSAAEAIALADHPDFPRIG